MIVTHKLSPMDLTARGVTQQVDVVQDDKYSRNLEFTLTQSGSVWPIPKNATAVIRYKKSDGTGGNYDTLPDGSAAYTISGNVLRVALAPQVCTAPGRVRLAVGLVQGNTEINTFTVHILVQPNPGVRVVSEDYNRVTGCVKSSGWKPNMLLGTDAGGNVVALPGAGGNANMVGNDKISTATEDGRIYIDSASALTVLFEEMVVLHMRQIDVLSVIVTCDFDCSGVGLLTVYKGVGCDGYPEARATLQCSDGAKLASTAYSEGVDNWYFDGQWTSDKEGS